MLRSGLLPLLRGGGPGFPTRGRVSGADLQRGDMGAVRRAREGGRWRGPPEVMTETPVPGWDDRRMYGTGDLAVFLGGSESSFTGLLIVLMQKADPGNLPGCDWPSPARCGRGRRGTPCPRHRRSPSCGKRWEPRRQRPSGDRSPQPSRCRQGTPGVPPRRPGFPAADQGPDQGGPRDPQAARSRAGRGHPSGARAAASSRTTRTTPNRAVTAVPATGSRVIPCPAPRTLRRRVRLGPQH